MGQEIIESRGDHDRAYALAAERVLTHLDHDASATPVLGLCGGRSVVGLLKALKEVAESKKVNALSRVHFFMVDERLVPLTDEQSNFGMLKKLLFDDLVSSGIIQESQLHPFVPDAALADHGTSAYMKELSRYGGAFSAVVLGIGEDGHVAGLFPRHPVLQRAECTFISFYDSPKPPPQRMSATVSLLQSASMCVVLALGEGKREAWGHFRDPNTSLEACPSVLTREIETTLVVTDLA